MVLIFWKNAKNAPFLLEPGCPSSRYLAAWVRIPFSVTVTQIRKDIEPGVALVTPQPDSENNAGQLRVGASPKSLSATSELVWHCCKSHRFLFFPIRLPSFLHGFFPFGDNYLQFSQFPAYDAVGL